ncbi:hypothetical protein [Methanosarcina sp. WH1]|uniref:hypothetical protein n=1 Tax=Methanosarcina sp. WH1 TaxID=1434102 RepID=UPI000AC016CE|nr:hypothetical protein [Methanosarcina sp. WH1]
MNSSKFKKIERPCRNGWLEIQCPTTIIKELVQITGNQAKMPEQSDFIFISAKI